MMSYDPLETEFSDNNIKLNRIQSRADEIREELKGYSLSEVSAYRKRYAPRGFFDFILYLNDVERIARVMASESVLTENFPGMKKNFRSFYF